jgi:hypothetical protein
LSVEHECVSPREVHEIAFEDGWIPIGLSDPLECVNTTVAQEAR